MAEIKKTRGRPKKKVEVRLGAQEQTVEQIKETTLKNTKKKGIAVVGAYTPKTNLTTYQLKEFLLKSLWAETCVNIIVDEVIKNKLVTEPYDKEIAQFLNYPSEKEPLLLIRKKYLKDMMRFGNGGAAIIFKNNKPYQLQVQPGYAIRPTTAEPITYKFLDITQNSESSYKKDAKGVEIELALNEFMHFAYDMDSDMTMGKSPIDRGYYPLNIDKQLYINFDRLVKNGFFLPFMVGAKDCSSKDMDEFLEFLSATIQEQGTSFGINSGIDFNEIPHFTVDEILSTMKWTGLVIANMYKVPPFMLNLISGEGSMNAREQKTRFIENVVVPILEYEAYMYTIAICRKGFEKNDVEIKSPSIYNKLTYEKARIARQMVPTGNLMTVDEARELFLDLNPIKTDNSSDNDLDNNT